MVNQSIEQLTRRRWNNMKKKRVFNLKLAGESLIDFLELFFLKKYIGKFDIY